MSGYLIETISKDQDKYLNNITKGNELWLCENNLKDVLIELFPNQEIIHDKQIILKEKKFRPDYKIPSKKLLIEFNSYHHFTDVKTIYNDSVKKNLIENSKWLLIEIPYFIQLTYNVIDFLFSKFVEVENIKDFSNGFPHGFINPKACIPGNFCFMGLQRLKKIFSEFPKEVENQCFKSLKIRSKIDDIDECIYNPLTRKNENKEILL